jgi:hypothetical protein
MCVDTLPTSGSGDDGDYTLPLNGELQVRNYALVTNADTGSETIVLDTCADLKKGDEVCFWNRCHTTLRLSHRRSLFSRSASCCLSFLLAQTPAVPAPDPIQGRPSCWALHLRQGCINDHAGLRVPCCSYRAVEIGLSIW